MVQSPERASDSIDDLKAEQIRLWTEYVADTREAIDENRQLVLDLKQTLSWRVTRPLRAVRGAGRAR